MEPPFVYELEDRAASGRWGRFFGHTSEVAPLAAGVDLVKALDRVGWRALFVSSTRPAWSKWAGCAGGVRASTCRSSPEWTYVYELVDLDVAGDAQLTSWPGFLTLTPYAAE
ncbi:MAG TPA: hypothetical protein VLZ05_10460 [Mycobacterium sp.]|nr:hypothetical protein [Mycobacterium sp.]HUH69254.1 hypothetical protein [Mycobacterium sp.]